MNAVVASFTHRRLRWRAPAAPAVSANAGRERLCRIASRASHGVGADRWTGHLSSGHKRARPCSEDEDAAVCVSAVMDTAAAAVNTKIW
jgi:hypothetical protein